jgi:hypothetical protein
MPEIPVIMLAALIPMGVNGRLDGFKRGLVNGSFADGNGPPARSGI